MIDIKTEFFTAKSAIDAGVLDAVKRREIKIQGSYELTSDGFLNFKQQKFIFTDKNGKTRCGEFHSSVDLIEFWRSGWGTDNENTDQQKRINDG